MPAPTLDEIVFLTQPDYTQPDALNNNHSQHAENALTLSPSDFVLRPDDDPIPSPLPPPPGEPTLIPDDNLLTHCFGESIRSDPGTTHPTLIPDDEIWQKRWLRAVQLQPSLYNLPNSAIAKVFLAALTRELHGVRSRTWNSERPMLFALVILQKSPQARHAKDIRRRISQRLSLWNEGRFDALINDIEEDQRNRPRNLKPADDMTDIRRFNQCFLSGRTSQAVRNFIDPSDTAVLLPDDPIDESTTVLDALKTKHPDQRSNIINLADADRPTFEPYPDLPSYIPVDITSDTVADVATHLSGGAGPSGVDGCHLKTWLTRYGNASSVLRDEMASFGRWLANDIPSWDATRALMANRLVALDKNPGVRPIGIGETYRRLLAKCLLRVSGHKATAACNNYNLCVGLPAGIEGAVHTMSDLMDSILDASPETLQELNHRACLLIDAKNGFNELNRRAMLWTVRHLWPQGSCFAFNCYSHAAQLII